MVHLRNFRQVFFLESNMIFKIVPVKDLIISRLKYSDIQTHAKRFKSPLVTRKPVTEEVAKTAQQLEEEQLRRVKGGNGQKLN